MKRQSLVIERFFEIERICLNGFGIHFLVFLGHFQYVLLSWE